MLQKLHIKIFAEIAEIAEFAENLVTIFIYTSNIIFRLNTFNYLN
jgi:hypothetical protein